MLAKIRRAIKDKCNDAKLSVSDIDAATCYAMELLEAAEEKVDLDQQASCKRQEKNA